MREFESVPVETHWSFTFRNSLPRLNSELGKKKLKGAIVVIIRSGNKLTAGVSCCSKKDDWDGGLGETIAFQRAKLAASSDWVANRVLSVEDLPNEDWKVVNKFLFRAAKNLISSIELDDSGEHETRVDFFDVGNGLRLKTALSI